MCDIVYAVYKFLVLLDKDSCWTLNTGYGSTTHMLTKSAN